MKTRSFLGCVLILWIQSFTAVAGEYTFGQALENMQLGGLTLPMAEEDGRIRTLNMKGSMFRIKDMASASFLASVSNKTVLEIGAAYGNILLESLNLGFKKYVVNDLDPRHLFIAASRVKEKLAKEVLDTSVTERISFVDCEFGATCAFRSDSFDAILAARVLHFFTPDKLVAGIKDLYRILKPGGRVYAVAATPYIRRYSKFIPEYENRVGNGDRFPGYVENLEKYLDLSLISKEELKKVNNYVFMFLDTTVLSREFRNAGFDIKVLKVVPLEYESEIWGMDGRENVVIIAEKPAEVPKIP
jgi:SAM-dependent methyltransferase